MIASDIQADFHSFQRLESSSPEDLTYISELSHLSLSDSEQIQESPWRRAAATATAGGRGYPVGFT